jgi:DeoR/GlpR family transcriptional regulator of sugar metabolism
MFAQERQQKIIELLRKRSRLSVPELEKFLDASPATIRRDLNFLEDSGKVLRTHGGILSPDHGGGEVSYDRKSRQELGAKMAIAQIAAKLVKAGDSVFVDSGSTAFRVGSDLLSHEGISVFTNSVPLLSENRVPECRLVSIGGEVRMVSQALIGAESLGWLRRLRLDIAFIGASGIDPLKGPCTTELSEAGVKVAAIRGSRRVVLIADSSKWGQRAAIRFASWAEISDVITDYRPTENEQRQMAKQGVHLHLVKN